MPKGTVENNHATTTLAELRDQIRQLEIGVANLQGRRSGVIDLLRLRSRVEEAMERFQTSNVDVRPERTRLNSVDNALHRQAAIVVREAGNIGGLERIRKGERPPERYWWWYLDREVAERRRRNAIRLSSIVIGLAVLVLIVNYALNAFFGMKPSEKEAHELITSAEMLVRDGKYDQAIEEYKQAIELAPSLGDAYVALGVLYELQGHHDEAQQQLNKARELYADEATYELAVAEAYERAGQIEKALEAVNRALEQVPNSAQAYLVRAGIYEQNGDRGRALADLERAAQLASEQGEDALYVLAKTRMGMLSQQVPLESLGSTNKSQ